MKRREFLAKLGAGALAAGSMLLENPLEPRFRVARAASGKVLVVIFQAGGNDGLNTVVPYGDPDYYVHRPSIAIAPPDAADPNAAVNIDGFFGFHPTLAPFEPIYAAGDMAIMPAVHYPNAVRSHFDSRLWIQSGVAGPATNLKGWLNRHLATQSGGGIPRAIALTGFGSTGMPDSVRGSGVVSAFSDMRNYGLDVPTADEIDLLARLEPLYSQPPGSGNAYEAMIHDMGQLMMNDVAILRSIDFQNYTPANGAAYPDTKLGTAMKQTAQLIKEDVGLELATLHNGGWDTHTSQGQPENITAGHALALTDFGGSIAAFYNDLGSRMSDVVVLSMTEFGRTARQNGSGGTDHGNASAWFAIGKGINGGMYLGSGWPGLAPENLHGNRDLAHTIDYRNVLCEVISRHMGNPNLSAVVPAHTYAPIGFLPG